MSALWVYYTKYRAITLYSVHTECDNSILFYSNNINNQHKYARISTESSNGKTKYVSWNLTKSNHITIKCTTLKCIQHGFLSYL